MIPESNSSQHHDLLKQATLLKLALRTQGINVIDPVEGIGEAIKEHIDGLYGINKPGAVSGVPNELTLYQHITTKLVFNPESRFSLRKSGDRHYVFSEFCDDPLLPVEFTRRPKFYGLETSQGTPMKYIGQVMGKDCLAIAVDKQCAYFKEGKFCRYCNINATNHKSGLPRRSQLDDLGELIRAAGRNYRFIDLTGGTFEDRDEECRVYAAMGNIIRDNLGRNTFSGPFSLSPPKNLALLEELHNTGVDVVSFNMDVWDDKALQEICPGKYEIGKSHYMNALQRAKELWGRGNSVMQFLAGPWESNTSLLQGVEHMLRNDILVNITTFQASPGSTFRNCEPKNLSELVRLYLDYGALIKKYGFYPNSRRSILTSESGNRSSIVNEVVKGYLTWDNFDPDHDLKFAGGYSHESEGRR